MIFQYSQDYHPPAPVADITIIAAAEDLRVGPLVAFVDSGADGTLIPVTHLDAIHAPATVERYIRSQWGESRRVLLYLVDIQIGNVTLPGIEVVGDDVSDEIVLGRDVLNRLRVVLDGPQQVVDIRG